MSAARRPGLQSTWACALLALAGAASSLWLGWFTEWSPDTVWQHQQAVSGVYADQHPPAMAALWRLLAPAWRGGRGILFLQAAAYWGAAFVILSPLRRGPVPALRFALAVLAFAAPASVALVGVIWKDVHLGLAWGLAAALLIRRARLGRPAPLLTAAAVTLIVYGALVRYNAFLALPPLLLTALTGRPWLKRWWTTLAAGLLILLGGFAAFHVVTYGLLRAERTKTVQMALPAFDMAAIAARTGRDAFPFPMSAAQVAQIGGCYTPAGWDRLFFDNSPCRWAVYRLEAYEAAGHSVGAAWLRAIASAPGAYLRHRLAHSRQFYCLPGCDGPIVYRARFASDDHRAPAADEPVRLEDAYRTYLDHAARTPAMRPWGAVVAALAIAALAWRMRLRERGLIAGLCATSLFYLLPFALIGVASDQRYAFVSFVLDAFAAAVLLLSRWAGDRAA